MKKLILREEETNIIFLNQIDQNSIVGIKWGEVKSIIMHDKRGYFSVANDSCDLDAIYFGDDLKKYIARANNQKALFFVFENIKECLKWMSE